MCFLSHAFTHIQACRCKTHLQSCILRCVFLFCELSPHTSTHKCTNHKINNIKSCLIIFCNPCSMPALCFSKIERFLSVFVTFPLYPFFCIYSKAHNTKKVCSVSETKSNGPPKSGKVSKKRMLMKMVWLLKYNFTFCYLQTKFKCFLSVIIYQTI